MKVAAPLAKNILATLEIIATASAIDVGIQKKIHGSGTTTLIISNEEMNDIIKIVQTLEDFLFFFLKIFISFLKRFTISTKTQGYNNNNNNNNQKEPFSAVPYSRCFPNVYKIIEKYL